MQSLMKKKVTNCVAAAIILLSAITTVKAQYMPAVFDRHYGKDNRMQHLCPMPGNELAAVGQEAQ